MNPRFLTCVSLGLNLLLAGMVARPPRSAEAPPTRLPVPSRPRAAAPAPTRPETNVMVQTVRTPFVWDQVAAPDLEQYRDNLRAVGCPERTVRDIIVSLVNREFVRQMEELFRPLQGRFWELLAKHIEDDDALEEEFPWVEEGIDRLDQDRRELLERLLGPNRGQPASPAYEFDDGQRELVDFLTPEQQQAYAALKLEYAQRWQELARQAGEENRGLSREDRQAHLAAEDAALQELLSPEEYFELKLRNSPHVRLRELRGTGLTAEEIRSIAALRLRDELAGNAGAGADRRARLGPPSDSEPGLTAADEARAWLGEERYARFEQAENPHFQTLQSVREKADLPPQLGDELFDVWQVAQDQAQALASDPGLTAEDRDAALEWLRGEAERAVRETLSGEAFRIYTEEAGEWWRELAPRIRESD